MTTLSNSRQQKILDALQGGASAVLSVTPTVDTSAYASGDVLANSTTLSNAVQVAGGTAILQSVTLLDEAAQGVAMYLVFFDTATALGTINSAPNITDAALRNALAIVPVSSGDWITVSGAKIATLAGLGIELKAAEGSRDLYFAILNGTGAPTFGNATDLKLKVGLL